ncbi:MAG TPA: GreA/GreB family elongation factor [Verrucomicrobiae bacterium]
MNKRAIVQKIIAKLTAEREVHLRAARYSRDEATHEQNKPENKYDTRGLEASYLARGQSRQLAELEAAIAEFEQLAVKKLAPTDPVDVGSLVAVEQLGETDYYFLGPRAGGTEIQHDRREILVITPQSPLGDQLLGQKAGENLQLKLGKEVRAAKIVSVE